MRSPADPSQQVPPGRVLPALEVRERAPLLREVRIRACYGADAPDAEDPPAGGSPPQTQWRPALHSPNPQDCQCLASDRSINQWVSPLFNLISL